MRGLMWSSTGGAGNDVASSSTYLGQGLVTVPAFAQPVEAARVRTTISQAGALGDPYGSGTRTIWWVYGVGPVKIVFEPNQPDLDRGPLRSRLWPGSGCRRAGRAGIADRPRHDHPVRGRPHPGALPFTGPYAGLGEQL